MDFWISVIDFSRSLMSADASDWVNLASISGTQKRESAPLQMAKERTRLAASPGAAETFTTRLFAKASGPSPSLAKPAPRSLWTSFVLLPIPRRAVMIRSVSEQSGGNGVIDSISKPSG